MIHLKDLHWFHESPSLGPELEDQIKEVKKNNNNNKKHSIMHKKTKFDGLRSLA